MPKTLMDLTIHLFWKRKFPNSSSWLHERKRREAHEPGKWPELLTTHLATTQPDLKGSQSTSLGNFFLGWEASVCVPLQMFPVLLHTSSAVTMAITLTPSSHTICQKSWHVCGKGPCVAIQCHSSPPTVTQGKEREELLHITAQLSYGCLTC